MNTEIAQPVIQTGFHAGEWAPALNARVDLGKYHSAAALLRNFFVDYRGGASTRTGTKYALQCLGPGAVRLIPFQASFTTNYVLEFGEGYIRFYFQGAPVLETAKDIDSATTTNPVGISLTASHGWINNNWIFIQNVGGMTQINGRYFIIAGAAGDGFTLKNLADVAVNGTAYGTYTSGGTASRVYTLGSPYTAAQLSELKFAQNANLMIITHPDHRPYALQLISATNWTLTAINFGTNVATPGTVTPTTNLAGAVNYSYIITAVDINGQESGTSPVASSTVANTAGSNGTITLSWVAVTGAQSYNIYRAGPSTAGVVPTGSSFGFISNVTGIGYADTFIAGIPVYTADFSDGIPITKNPFQGAGVGSVTVTSAGTYTSVPLVTIGAAPSGGTTATGIASLSVVGTPTVNVGGINDSVGNLWIMPNGVILVVATVSGGGVATSFQPMGFPGTNPGSISSGSTPTNPVSSITTSTGTGGGLADLIWGVSSVIVTNAGSGYTSVPSVTFSAGAATATAVLEASTAGNPIVPIFWNQRLVFGGTPLTPHRFNGSQPRSYYNFNVSDPIQPDDAFEGFLVASKLNTIQSFIVMSAGLITLADQQAWLVNGGSPGSVATPIDLAANSQAYNGCSGVPPIVANLDILYVQAKGSIVRSLTFNFYTNIYTGTDISVLSSHLFYGFNILEWAYAEEPFKVCWCVRDDGQLLSLTYLKEQELIGWSHSDTAGDFKSVCSITEQVQTFNGTTISVDAVYVVAERTIGGVAVKFVERMAERLFQYGVEDAWCVDAGLQSTPTITLAQSLASGNTLTLSSLALGTATLTITPTSSWDAANIGRIARMSGGIMTIVSVLGAVATVTITQAPSRLVNGPGSWSIWTKSTTFTGGEHLAGKTCTGLADGAVIPSFTMPATGIITLAVAASKVTVGLAYSPQLKTLDLDLGQPTVQGKRKKIVGVSVRSQDTLGLSLGKTLATVVPMKDLVVGNVGSQTDEVVTNRMVTGDAWTVMDQKWDVAGNYFVTQPNPFPATILGVIPDVTVGDS